MLGLERPEAQNGSAAYVTSISKTVQCGHSVHIRMRLPHMVWCIWWSKYFKAQTSGQITVCSLVALCLTCDDVELSSMGPRVIYSRKISQQKIILPIKRTCFKITCSEIHISQRPVISIWRQACIKLPIIDNYVSEATCKHRVPSTRWMERQSYLMATWKQ